jgi:hypothetical protein
LRRVFGYKGVITKSTFVYANIIASPVGRTGIRQYRNPAVQESGKYGRLWIYSGDVAAAFTVKVCGLYIIGNLLLARTVLQTTPFFTVKFTIGPCCDDVCTPIGDELTKKSISDL